MPDSDSLRSLEDLQAEKDRMGWTYRGIAQRIDEPLWAVKGVLQGAKKGARGAPHRVAVKLGLKHGVIESETPEPPE